MMRDTYSTLYLKSESCIGYDTKIESPRHSVGSHLGGSFLVLLGKIEA